eukprot:6210181-Prymnesium_polylepis.1
MDRVARRPRHRRRSAARWDASHQRARRHAGFQRSDRRREETLAERLRSGGVVEGLAKAILPVLRKLKRDEAAATCADLHGKFVQDGEAFTMKYGD